MSEKIGQVLLDTRYYLNNDQYSDGDEIENRLLEIVSAYPEKAFPRILTENPSWPLIYHLSPLRQSLLNWIPFAAGEKVLELGSGCGAVTGAFLGKGLDVTCVDLSLRRSRINATRHADCGEMKILIGASETVLPHLEERFDHVTLIGVLEYAAAFSDGEKPFHHILRQIQTVLKDDGSLWVAIENKLGLKYFAGCREDHTNRYFEGIEGYPHAEGPRTFSQRELLRLAEECGYRCEFYYPYPDYKFPVKVFSDGYLPREGELNRNWQYFGPDRIELFDESRGFDAALEAGLFPDLSNSFLVRMRKKEAAEPAGERVLYAKASVERRPAFRQQTLILQRGEERLARKIPDRKSVV